MITFPDLNKSSRIGIHGLLGPITRLPHSHKGAWARLIRWQLKELGYEHVEIVTPAEFQNLDQCYDVIMIEPGMEFKGTINFFGGLKDEDLTNLERLANFNGWLVACDQQCPDYATALRKRWEDWWPDQRKERLAISWENRRSTIPYFTHVAQRDAWVVGDSHALSAWRPGYAMARHDGLTLHGALQRGLRTLWPDVLTSKLVLYLGNIDVRHHLGRQSNPIEAAEDLALEYINEVAKLEIQDVTLVAPLYVEPETRRLPKTGYYKGTPFTGSRTDRAAIRDTMHRILGHVCLNRGWSLQSHPAHFTSPVPEFSELVGHLVTGPLDEAVMERPQSVHLSPAFYPYDLDTGLPRSF